MGIVRVLMFGYGENVSAYPQSMMTKGRDVNLHYPDR